MYSYEDRLYAVKLYLKLGRRLKATLLQLGYANRASLKEWCAEFEQTQDLRQGYRIRRGNYTPEQKHYAVAYYAEHGCKLLQTIRDIGYPCAESLRLWIREFRPDLGETISGSTVPHNQARRRTLKQQAVLALNMRVGSAQDVANAFGVTRGTLYQWNQQLRGNMPLAPTSLPRTVCTEEQRDELLKEVKALEARVQQLRLEQEILEKARELIKKDMGIHPLILTNLEKTKVVDALKDRYPLRLLLGQMQLARSTYFYHRLHQTLPDKYQKVRCVIWRLFENNYCCYGYRRMGQALHREGIRLSEKVVRRLMREESLKVATPRRQRFSTYDGERMPAAPNLLKRDFSAEKPNKKWLTDLTEIAIPAGKVYVSPIVDCFDGLIVAWRIGTRPDAQLVNTMLSQAVQTLQSDEHPIIHSDRGAHYRWPEWIRRTDSAKLMRSMSKKGCSPDNAACEGFFGRLKTEFFYPRQWRDITIEDFIKKIDTYIRWYNESRIKLSLGGRSPVEYRQALGFRV